MEQIICFNDDGNYGVGHDFKSAFNALRREPNSVRNSQTPYLEDEEDDDYRENGVLFIRGTVLNVKPEIVFIEV